MHLARLVGLSLFLSFSLVSVPAYAQTDFSGMWGQRYYEDQEERAPGGELGDYTGLPLNDAARLRADSWDASPNGNAVPTQRCICGAACTPRGSGMSSIRSPARSLPFTRIFRTCSNAWS